MKEKKAAAALPKYGDKTAVEYADNTLDAVLSNVDSFVRKQYLTILEQAGVAPLDTKRNGIVPGRNMRLFRLLSFSYGEDDDLWAKLSNVFGAVSEFDSRQVLILDSDGSSLSLYLGIAGDEPDRLSLQFETFKGSFLGNFPGGKISVLNVAKNEELLSRIFDEENIKISAVSALAGEKTGGRIYGIEHLADGMYGRPFTMILLSCAVSGQELYRQRQNLEAMYTELSPFRDYTVSVNKNESEGYTQSCNLTKSESVSEGKSITENTTFTTSRNRSETVSANPGAEERKAKNQLVGTALSLAAILSGLGVKAENAMHPLQGLFYGGSIAGVLGSVQTLLDGSAPAGTETTGEGETYSLGFSEGETMTWQKGYSVSKGISDSRTDAQGRTLQMRYENRAVADLLDVIEEQIVRLKQIGENGGFQCAAYFVAGDNATARMAANMYRSLLGTAGCSGFGHAIQVWSDERKIEGLCEYLKRMSHPLFYFERKPNYPTFTAGVLVAADELARYVSLPGRSLAGLPVAVRAEFARDVIKEDGDPSDRIEIGNIFHMGKAGMSKVFLSKSDLSGHIFVAGATGMGKSNFCYGLLDSLYREKIKFMVIEPAKGEYKQVFGGREDVSTFGTNPLLTPLLRINPFSFPAGIHVNEHISRLLEIFNSCWPMYAAMPEVLKEGLEIVYRRCGYNLVTGHTKRPGKFPVFADLLQVLPEIIRKSEFSGEVKGNYIGSLVTRVKSLTGGLYGCILTEDEIEDRVLFDENVLIDLSRAGSGEIRALLMGILIMKLQEYRMCHAKMNAPLRHVTVLEEAHHLLKASSLSSAEGVNLRAMSLEMISNAIAEMRTFGEGFLIADQSPSQMDSSVLRNTNTKVAFKLPERSDRLAMGAAMSLSDAQMNEMARLERGVAAVSQSSWDNAVLAKMNYYGDEKFAPYTYSGPDGEADERQIVSQCLAVLMRDRLSCEENSSVDPALCGELLAAEAFADEETKEYLAVIRRYLKEGGCRLSFG